MKKKQLKKVSVKADSSLVYAAAVVIFLVIIFLQPTLVGGRVDFASYISEYDPKYCNGNGHVNATDRLCNCFQGYYGAQCTLKYCPFGKSWQMQPTADHTRTMPTVECSNMGLCNSFTGICTCRSGYEGRACERLSCPKQTEVKTTVSEDSKTTSGFYVITSSTSSTTYEALDPTKVKPCTGHGMCMTMREASNTFNGRNLIYPPNNYDGWDADMVQGCVCDKGWTGVDCSLQSCPYGPDPLSTETYQQEVYQLYCKADGGYFSLNVQGYFTNPIPYNADPAYLKLAIETLPVGPGVGNVLISMPATAGVGAVCSATGVATSISFKDYNGKRNPIYISLRTSNTRMWPDGGTSLSLASSTTNAKLRMQTVYTVTCPVCVSCSGSIHFTYGDSITASIDVTSSSGFANAMTYILALSDLSGRSWPNLDAVVTGTSTAFCSSSSISTTTITLYSDYGNIHDLGIKYSVLASTTVLSLTYVSVTAGVGAVYECSNQGVCNRDSGKCACFEKYYDSTLDYRFLSSDGYGASGSRGDCGYLETAKVTTSCTYDNDYDLLCSGHGYCNAGVCICQDGWNGINCAVGTCAFGTAWFDEAVSSAEAHQSAECSNQGICNRVDGYCECRSGYSGKACQYRECPSGADSTPCSGHGWCMNPFEVAEMLGYTYGPSRSTNVRRYPSEWDYNMEYQCVCSAQVSAGYFGHYRYPTVDPSAMVSGISAGGKPQPGWTGYDCSQRRCPAGDNVNERHTLTEHKLEVQRIVCTAAAASIDTFYLTLYGQISGAIYASYTASQIKDAIEKMKSVGNVTISFPHSYDDAIVTACSVAHDTSDGGFLVQFDTELGDVPLVTASSSAILSSVAVAEYVKGSALNLECGGPEMGYCHRDTGLCECTLYQYSSDAQNGIGNRGDCGYHYKEYVDAVSTTSTVTIQGDTNRGSQVTFNKYKDFKA